jgi:CubicO group peptidase (beta-lactamase class C family)
MAERIFEPLGMTDTGFWVPEAKLDRLAAPCARDDRGALIAWDDRRPGGWSRPPVFEAGGGGLVSTAKDFHAFAAMLLDRGRHDSRPILSPESVAEMTRDQIAPEQKAASPFASGFWDTNGWGLGMSVTTARDGVGGPGRFGWAGGYGTAFEADPETGIVAILLMQRLMKAPDDLDIAREFLKLGYAAAA